MNGRERDAELASAYRNIRAQFMAILYEEDPEGFGSSVSAPEDEYSEEAARLIVVLRGARTVADVRDRLSQLYDKPSNSLAERVHRSWVDGGGPDW